MAPQLDATSLAEALWLASRMGADHNATSPGQGAETAAPTEPEAPRPRPSSASPDQAPVLRPPALPAPELPTRTLHERLPGSASPVPGHAVAVPRPSALPLALPLTRALRPWKRPWRTGRRHTLDVAATVDGYARSGELLPVLTPAPERWFDLTLVVDRSPSMQVWRETVDAFTGVLDQLGAFRTLQVRDLRFGTDHGLELTDRQGRPVSARQPGSADGRRLIVVVSDCTAGPWRAPEVWQRLRTWGRSAPLALLNPLPTKLWRRTGLDLPTARVTPGAPGGSNAGLTFRLPPLLPRTDGGSGDGRDEWLAVPVLSLSPHSLRRWSRAVMLAAPEGCAAALVPSGGRPAPGRDTAPARPSTLRDTESRAEGFLRTAAPAAARLAVLCSTFDRLSLDLLHVLRQELVPEAGTADVAELIGSDLFALHTDASGTVVLQAPEAIRTRLEQSLPEHEALRLSRALNRHVATRREGRGHMPMVAGGAADGPEAVAAESTPAGRALARTLELLGLPGGQGRTIKLAPATETSSATEVSPTPAPASPTLLPPVHVQEPPPDPTELALRIVAALLPTGGQLSRGDLTAAVEVALTLLHGQGLAADPEVLVREVESGHAVFQESASGSDVFGGQEQWIRTPLPQHNTFWGRYLEHLDEDARPVPPDPDRIDRATDRLLGRLDDPRRPGHWHRAGLVVAPVQSGRTRVVIGLAAKALDAGYRVIVVLTGPSNDDRLQTQRLVDEGLLGFDSAYQMVGSRYEPPRRPVGVGAFGVPDGLEIATLTSTSSDFTARGAARLNAPPDAYPLVFVIKKNKRVVEAVRSWLARHTRYLEPYNGLPLLVVESASAGHPTAADDVVHHLLAAFPKSAYVSFAFAPFLPVPGPGGQKQSRYPDHFVHNLWTHPGEEPQPVAQELLPLVREVTDQEEWLPTRHDATHTPGRELPPSLVTAVHSFVLACAVRRAREERAAHNSMLVSVSRFTAVQAHVRDQLAGYVRLLASALAEPGSERLTSEFHSLWQSDFAPASDVTPDSAAEAVAWARAEHHLADAARKTDVVLVNSGSDGMPAWHAHPEGLNVVAVGGTKLGQGTALEGLTVGYYVRATGTYGTLLQLNSAFRYRTGYEDLCRLYATPEVLGRRRQSLDAFSGAVVETRYFRLTPAVLRRNFRMVESFVRSLDKLGRGPRSVGDGNLLWDDVPPERVVTGFLDPYQPALPPAGEREPVNDLSAFVRRRMADGDAAKWTVQIANPTHRRGTVDVAGHRVGLVVRRPLDAVSPDGTYRLKVLRNPRDDQAGLDEDQVLGAAPRPGRPLLTIYLIDPAPEDTGETLTAPLTGFTVRFPRPPVLPEVDSGPLR
ncbi:SAV_2336 N-terminal domain-related protein [Streptomyces sp. 3214.6]|uniref:SAV_2336 N-terminal domain-related protein n=1 Tax=Streptomyces sp. 3214.6 TaxID=1882757 RepID=UPI0013521097|nr:SAV_2336 N-terminal domain-related protein [Streptomyces sp. 3214.6]